MEVSTASIPPELVYHILTLAAGTSRRSCLTLCRVSSWTRELAEPCLKATLIFDDPNPAVMFLQHYFPRWTPREKKLVRHVWTDHPYLASFLFDACQNITHMAVNPNIMVAFVGYACHGLRSTPEMIAKRPDIDWTLTEYIGSGPFEVGSAFSQASVADTAAGSEQRFWPIAKSVLSKITRVRMPVVSDYARDVDITPLPRITHLSVPFCFQSHDLSQLERIMEHPSLRFLVVTILSDLISDNLRHTFETWFQTVSANNSSKVKVGCVEAVSTEFKLDWETEMWGGRSIWDACPR